MDLRKEMPKERGLEKHLGFQMVKRKAISMDLPMVKLTDFLMDLPREKMTATYLVTLTDFSIR